MQQPDFHYSTPQDAANAYLRDEISEEDFKSEMAYHGVHPGDGTFYNGNRRFDDGFEKKLPDDVVHGNPAETGDTPSLIQAQQKARDEVNKLAEDKAKADAGHSDEKKSEKSAEKAESKK